MQGLYRNGPHQRYEDDYEDNEYEDYEEECFEGEEDDGQEKVEERKPSKDELEFLKIREQLKEKFRQKLKKQSAVAFGHSVESQDRRRTSTNEFGSFFGPSQPVIASRVIDESRSIRETRHIVSKDPSSSSKNQTGTATGSSERKIYESHPRPKVNEVKKKAQTLKDMRDYSFLLSDDADFPDTKDSQPTSRHVSAPEPAQAPSKGKVSGSKPLNSASNGHISKNSTHTRQMQTKVLARGAQVSRPMPSSSEPRKLPGSNGSGYGPGWPSISAGGNASTRPNNTARSVDMPNPKPLPSKVSMQAMGTDKPKEKSLNNHNLQKKKFPIAKPFPSTQNHYGEQKRVQNGVRAAPRPAFPSSKPQPSKPIASRDVHDERLKKKPVKRRPVDDEDDADEAIRMIRNMFRYNPDKYAGMDDDDSDMEAGFSQIQKEERRSAKIAREEDEEQLRLIEEEERRERMRKKQKLNRR